MLQPDARAAKRTNSLAFCKTDCHTCASLGQRCDRRRPQCSTCLGQGRKCGGFATPLVWDDRRMWADKPSSAAAENSLDAPAGPVSGQAIPAKPASRRTSPSRSGQSRHFRFVTGASRAKRRRRAPSVESPAEQPPAPLPDSPQFPDVEDDAGSTGNDMPLVNNNQVNNNNWLGDFESSISFLVDNPNIFDTPAPGVCDAMPFNSSNLGQQGSSAPDVPDITALSPITSLNALMERNTQGPSGNRDQPDPLAQDLNSILAGAALPTPLITQNDNRHSALGPYDIARNGHESILQLYDSEFCILPLTSDIRVNPFRSQPRVSQESRLLFHCILALCCQHLNRLTGSWSTEAVEHRRQASQLLEYAVQNGQNKTGFDLLEPILIMFTLDCTVSAAGNWSTHLTRARSVLQACGGPSALNNARVRSQVGMLIWWDVTLALISRQAPIIDQSYLDFLVQWEKHDEWSFFDLAGCPRELVTHLYQLAELAKQIEIASSMKWLSFNMTPVAETEQKVANWQNNLSPTSEEANRHISDEEAERQFHDQQDRYHCAEAWRYTLLIYIERIFKCGPDQPRSRAMVRLVRDTLDHVRCCRRTSQTQKQLLLPVLLAGSETSDEDMRDFVKWYCKYWGEKTRYSMFNSAPALLDEIWATGKWWGAVIDSKSKPLGPGELVTQFLFG